MMGTHDHEQKDRYGKYTVNSTCGGEAGHTGTGVQHSDCSATTIRQYEGTALDEFR